MIKAIKEAEILGKSIAVVSSSKDKNYSYIPQNIQFNDNAVYVHITSNNTIKGTQWASFPETGVVPIVSDMSSDIMIKGGFGYYYWMGLRLISLLVV